MTQTQTNPETTAPENPIYQALGTVLAEVVYLGLDAGYHLKIGGKVFPASFPIKATRKAAKLVGAGPLYFRVWPQRRGAPDSPLGFRVLSWRSEVEKDWPAGIFRLSGIWQFIPQSKKPVFSIYRNDLRDGEKSPALAQHLPLQWTDGPKPWRWRPNSDKPPACYQLAARLDPETGAFVVLTALGDPCDPPRRVKLPKSTRKAKPAKGAARKTPKNQKTAPLAGTALNSRKAIPC